MVGFSAGGEQVMDFGIVKQEDNAKRRHQHQCGDAAQPRGQQSIPLLQPVTRPWFLAVSRNRRRARPEVWSRGHRHCLPPHIGEEQQTAPSSRHAATNSN
jgi:hypothetical protein